MTDKKQEGTKPENVLVETLIIFGLVILVKHMNNYMKNSKSIVPVAAAIAIGYYIIMYVVSRVRPCMCDNIRNSITWAAGTSLTGI